MAYVMFLEEKHKIIKILQDDKSANKTVSLTRGILIHRHYVE